MEDLFAETAATEDVFDKVATNKTPGGFQAKKENYWDKQDIEPLEINVTKFKKSGKSFAIYVHPENDIPKEAHDTIVTLAKGLMGKGYTFRHCGNSDNSLHNAILALETTKVVSYLPWKSFNTAISNPVLPTPTGYRIAISVHKAFARLSSAVRAIISKDVNTLLGEEANDPIDFILAWTDGGDEVLGKNMDFKKIGNNTFILQIARKANIPVLNVFNANFIDRFKEIIQ